MTLMMNARPQPSYPSTSSNANMDKHQTSLTIARLLSQRQWSLLESLLSSSHKDTLPIDDPTLPHAITAEIVIHFAARFQAPLRILSLLVRLYPQSLVSSDITGRYPIHVASKWGATPDVIAYLIKSNPSVAGVPDSTGKTPMHYVGECYIAHFNNDCYSREDSMLQVVRLLKNAAPNSVNLEDNDGMNAIEYALCSDANLKVVKTMQRACRDDWRQRSKSSASITPLTPEEGSAINELDVAVHTKLTPRRQHCGRRRHEDLVNDMKTMAMRLQRQYSEKNGEEMKLDSERVHVHKSTTKARTHAARTA